MFKSNIMSKLRRFLGLMFLFFVFLIMGCSVMQSNQDMKDILKNPGVGMSNVTLCGEVVYQMAATPMCARPDGGWTNIMLTQSDGVSIHIAANSNQNYQIGDDYCITGIVTWTDNNRCAILVPN